MKRFKQLIYLAGFIFFGLICSKLGFDYGTEKGYRNGKEAGLQTVEDLTQYEILTIESVRSIDSLQNNIKP